MPGLKPPQFDNQVLMILNSLDEGIHVVNEEGITVLYNRRAAELDNLRTEEVLGHHVLEVFPSLSAGTSTLLQVLATGQPVTDRQQTFQNFKGDTITTTNSTRPIVHDGRLLGAVEISRDITLLKDMAEQLVDLQAELYAKKTVRPRRVLGRAGFTFEQIIGSDVQIQALKDLARRTALGNSAVLVYGETGTGKELFAQAIHNSSRRADRPFIAQNCAALPDTLLESILFGTVKGAFTGADDRPGLFEVADGGTLYLDEIDSMPLHLQPKLLRVLQDGQVRRVGDVNERSVHVRLISSSRTNPREAVKQGLLREDLYYRINVVSLRLPPLRERMNDIPALVEAFIAKHNQTMGKSVKRATPAALDALSLYTWPGNVRELEHFVEATMATLDGDEINPVNWHWTGMMRGDAGPAPEGGTQPAANLRPTLRGMEEELVRHAMAECGGNLSQAARKLGIPRQTLQYRLRKLGLRVEA